LPPSDVSDVTSDLTFVAPTSLEEALAELADEGAVAVAGGTSMALLLKNRLVGAERLVYLGRITQLAGLTAEADLVRLGALTTVRELSRSPLIRAEFPMLAGAAGEVGNPRVRSVATLGGAVVHADPRQDLPPVLLALEALVRVTGPSGSRELPLSDFFLGFMDTALEEDELVTEVVLPRVTGVRTAYLRFNPGSADDYPTICVAVALGLAPDGTVERARIVLGGVASTALVADAAAAGLVGSVPDTAALSAAAGAAAAAASPTDDQRGSASYKRAMAEVWTERALRQCLTDEVHRPA
jgi:carbon-monoxide dehydrogenase medium subunit